MVKNLDGNITIKKWILSVKKVTNNYSSEWPLEEKKMKTNMKNVLYVIA